ncbi:MAG: ESPR-type extended signal peptide-containing protein, partial [Moraxella sp.]
MNKIFKIVWSEAVGAFVVASELAKGHTKSTTVKKTATGLKILFRLTALAVAVWGSVGTAWAAIPEKTATGGATFAIGNGSTSANGTGALAIGNNAQAKANGALAIGPNSTHMTAANSNNSIAIGVNLRADGTKAIGIGADTTVNGTGAIAIGNNDSARMADQGVDGNGAIGVGSNLTARGNNAIAVGTEAQAKANHAIAIGTGTQATGEDSIAIGRSEGTKLAQATTKQSLAIGWTAQATGTTQAVAIGPDAIASGTQSTSIGNNTRATGDSSIAIGGDDWNIVRTKQVAAAGNKLVHQVFEELTGMEMKYDAAKEDWKGTTSADAAVAVGVKAYAEGVLSTAFGSGTSATGLGASAFGVGAEASKDKSVAIGAGSNTSTNATAVTTAIVNDVTYSGFAGTTHITEGSQVSVGRAGYERQIKHVAPGEISATSTDAINGSQLYQVAAQAANPLKFDGDSGTTVERKLGSTLNVKGGATGTLTDNNIGVVADNNSNNLRLKLAQNVNLGAAGSLRTGDTTVNSNGVAITGGPSITKTGISAGNKPITNVASGGTTDSNAANIGDVKKAAAAAKTEVQAGTNVASVIKTDGTNGQAIYTVNAKATAVALDSSVDGLKLTSSEDTTTNVTTYKL